MAGIDKVLSCLINGGRKNLPKSFNVQQHIDSLFNVDRTAFLRVLEDTGNTSIVMGEKRAQQYATFMNWDLDKIANKFRFQENIEELVSAKNINDFRGELERMVHSVTDKVELEKLKLEVGKTPYANDSVVTSFIKKAEDFVKYGCSI